LDRPHHAQARLDHFGEGLGLLRAQVGERIASGWRHIRHSRTNVEHRDALVKMQRCETAKTPLAYWRNEGPAIGFWWRVAFRPIADMLFHRLPRSARSARHGTRRPSHVPTLVEALPSMRSQAIWWPGYAEHRRRRRWAGAAASRS